MANPATSDGTNWCQSLTCVYRDEPVQDWRAHDLVIRAVDCRAITPSQVPEVVQEWREPSHTEFRPRNLWSLFNAFTEVYKSQSPMLMAHDAHLDGTDGDRNYSDRFRGGASPNEPSIFLVVDHR